MTIIIAALIVAACVPGLCADSLTTGSDAKADFSLGGYLTNSSGNQDQVRQYDGRTFHAPNIETFDSYGYHDALQYWFLGRDLGVGNSDALIALSSRNHYGLRFGYSQLTHRRLGIPAIDPFVSTTVATTGNNVLDLSPNDRYFIDRAVTDLSFGAAPWNNQVARFVLGFWEEHESGTQQLLFRARQAFPGVIANRQRGSVGNPIDRTLRESILGTDIRIGSSSAFNYRFYSDKFGENNGRPQGAQFNFLPLNAFTIPGSSTESHVFKARTSIGNRLYITGAQSNRNRKSTRVSAGNPTVNLNSTNIGATFLATDDLNFTARYRRFSQQPGTIAVFNAAGDPTNATLARKVKGLEFETTYAGVPRTFFRAGYERRNTDRDATPAHAAHEEFEHPIISSSTDSNIMRLGARYYPFSGLSVAASYEDWTFDSPGYTGSPSDRKKINANVNYMLRDNMAFFANYSMLDDKNNLYPVVVSSIPTPATDAATQEIREDAAGQGSRNTFKTIDLGAWYALNSKLTLDLNYARITTDASALWIIGTDFRFVPHLAPEQTPFFARDNQWSLGATYAITPKSRFYGRFLISDVSGKTTIDPTIMPQGLGPVWRPVDAKENRWTAGFAHDINKRDTVLADFSISRWTDEIDAAASGWFSLVRFAWSRQY